MKNRKSKPKAEVKQEQKKVSIHAIDFDFERAKFNVMLNDGSKLENVSNVKLSQQYSGTLVTIEVFIDPPPVAKISEK